MADPRRVGEGWNPHRRLAAAVLLDAVKSLKSASRAERVEARAWLRSRKGAGWMCLLGFDPDAFREGLARKGLL